MLPLFWKKAHEELPVVRLVNLGYCRKETDEKDIPLKLGTLQPLEIEDDVITTVQLFNGETTFHAKGTLKEMLSKIANVNTA